VSVHGAGAKLWEDGDCLIILYFKVTEEPVEPQVILVDQSNRFVEYLVRDHHAQQVH